MPLKYSLIYTEICERYVMAISTLCANSDKNINIYFVDENSKDNMMSDVNGCVMYDCFRFFCFDFCSH